MYTSLLTMNSERLDPIRAAYHPGNGYRAYNACLMRFLYPDSWSPFRSGGINGYAWCAGDPVNHCDPSGHMSWQAGLGIGLGIAGVLAAALTGGTSLLAAESLSALLAGTSTLSVFIGSCAVIADVTSISSAALEGSRPGASAVLGWISLTTGGVSLGTGLAAGGFSRLNNALRSVRIRTENILRTGLSGRGAAGAASQWAVQNAAQFDKAISNINRAETLSHPLTDLPACTMWAKSGRGKAMIRFARYYQERNPALYNALQQNAMKQLNDPFAQIPELVRQGYNNAKWLTAVGQFELPAHPSVRLSNLFAESPRDIAFREISKLTFFRAEEFRAVPPDPVAVRYLTHLYENTGIKEPLRFIHPMPDSTGFGPW